jgi:hypothetical protein
MSAPAIGLRPRVTPTKWVPVDWSHPLAPRGGWAALPHTGTDAFGHVGTITTNASRNGLNAFGAAASTSSASTGGIQFPTPAHLTAATSALTVVWVGEIVGLNTNNNQLLTIRDNASDASPFLVAGMMEDTSSGGTANLALRDQSGTYRTSTIASAFATGQGARVFIGVFDAANNVSTVYRDGNRVGSSSWSGVTALSWPASSPGIGVLGYGTNTLDQGVQGSCSMAAIYPSALSAAQVAAISADPFQIFRQ